MSIYTKTNPWKMYPRNLPCFCGSGLMAKMCLCTRLMPQMVTPRDAALAGKEMQEVVAYVHTLRKEGKIYIDEERAYKMKASFCERDGINIDETKMRREGDKERLRKIEVKKEVEFKKRRIDLDESTDGTNVDKSPVGRNPYDNDGNG